MTTARFHPLTTGLPAPWATRWGEDRFGAFQAFSAGGVTQQLRWIPPGSFLMGSPETESGRDADERPRAVEISHGLWLAETPVTQALWRAVMATNPGRFAGSERPVEEVSWEDCQRFCARLNEIVPGLGARLPTEAEWEHACRAGTTTATWVGDLHIDGDLAPELDAIAWYSGNSGGETHPVRGKAPNPLGLHDMLGNVWEWCSDWWSTYGAEPAVDPPGAPAGTFRVFRGGSWFSDARLVRAASRLVNPQGPGGLVGFRLACDPSPAPPPPAPPRRPL